MKFFCAIDLVLKLSQSLIPKTWKQISLSQVENIFVAAVQEWSDDFMEKVWYAYLWMTVIFLWKVWWLFLKHLEPSMAKWRKHHCCDMRSTCSFGGKDWNVRKSVLVLNEFMVTFFIGDKLYDKNLYLKFHQLSFCRRSADFICWRNYREIVITELSLKKAAIPLF
jgi:hypothetical protein